SGRDRSARNDESAAAAMSYRRFHLSPFFTEVVQTTRPKVSGSCLCIVPVTVRKPLKITSKQEHTPATKPLENLTFSFRSCYCVSTECDLKSRGRGRVRAGSSPAPGITATKTTRYKNPL